jgi:hypothetical protein
MMYVDAFVKNLLGFQNLQPFLNLLQWFKSYEPIVKLV